MKTRYLISFILAFWAMIGYQAFLVERDQKMYDSYYCKTIGCANER